MKKKLVLLSTGVGLVPTIVSIVKEQAPDIEVVNIVDDTIVNSIRDNDNIVPPSIFARMCDYCKIGESMGADALLLTCSSISEAIDVARPLVNIPLFKIDEPMIEKAVDLAEKSIGVAATLMTTLQPTLRQVQKKIELSGKNLVAVSKLSDGAFEAYLEGKKEIHDSIVANCVKELLEECDVVVLAQASMATAIKTLPEEYQKRVLTSPELGVARVISFLKEKGE